MTLIVRSFYHAIRMIFMYLYQIYAKKCDMYIFPFR